MNKVVLILADGMRPDGMLACEHPEVEYLMQNGRSTLEGRTVMPSVTLPCHMSMIHSVDPDRHGVTTNTYSPMVRPVTGLFEQLRKFEKKNAFFYSWGELKDLYQPSSLADARFMSGQFSHWNDITDVLTDGAIEYLHKEDPDFLFLYLGEPDEVGHKYGWMSPEYIQALHHVFASIERVRKALPEGHILMVTADHGGHDRIHGTDLREDTTIPFLAYGSAYAAGTTFERFNIKDIAPTIVKHLGVPADGDWEGEALI